MKWSIHDRVIAVLKGEKPDRLPFIDRLELWYTSLLRSDRLPEEFRGLSLTQIHREVGIGQQRWLPPYSFRLCDVDLTGTLDGEPFYRQSEPVIDRFPTMLDLVPTDRAGIATFELATPVGNLTVCEQTLEEALAWGETAYLTEHPIKDEDDFRTMQYILERVEYVPQYERFQREEDLIGEVGFVVPYLHRIPFQQVLIDYLGEIELFYGLHDNPRPIRNLIDLLHERELDILNHLADFPGSYVEFIDNLTGPMTNPTFFAEYCLPHYQLYSDILHGQGKRVGSHTDGDLQPLLELLAESGLDVCESISPEPLTPYTFDEVWQAWRDGPIIWGGIPSPLLEARTPERELRDYVDHVLELVGAGPIILGVGDMVMGNNLIERVRYVAERVEEHVI